LDAVITSKDSFRLQPDLERGFYSILFGGKPVVSHALISFELEEGTLKSVDARFSVQDRSMAKESSLVFSDAQGVFDFELTAKTIEDGAGLVFHVVGRNRSHRPLRVRNIFPLVATKENNGRFSFWSDLNDVKLLTDEWERCYGISVARALNTEAEFLSAWDVHLFEARDSLNFTASFYEVPNAKISFAIHRHDGSPDVDLVVKADTHSGTRGVRLNSGESFVLSELVLLLTRGSPLDALEHYAQSIAERNGVRAPVKVPVGWADWYFAYGTTDEDEALKNLDFVARELKDFGVEYFEIDSAWQLGVETTTPPDNLVAGGPWVPNSKFPHGMKWFADRIREECLKPGIWVRPFQMIDDAPERKAHPDWFNEKGQMDFSNPAVQLWVKNLFTMFVDDWGYQYIKFDFPSFDLFNEWGPKLFEDHSAHMELHDQTKTNIQAYRESLNALRESTAGKAFLLACNSVMPATLGLADSFRIGDDVGDWGRTFKYGVKSVSARYYTNGIYWSNDPDCLVVREPFTLDQARMWASLIALSGGVVFMSERVYALPPERLEIIKKVLPVFANEGKGYSSGRPIDLPDRQVPEVWLLPVRKSFETWAIVGAFNWSDVPTRKVLSMASLGLRSDVSYLAYEFWGDTFLGEVRQVVHLELSPHSCQILALHEKRAHPQLLSTTRHVTQGGVEIQQLGWDESLLTLSGVCQVIKDNPYEISIHVPQGFNVDQTEGVRRVETVHTNLLRVRVSSAETQQMVWSARFKKNEGDP
jgi:hypothetical protein